MDLRRGEARRLVELLRQRPQRVGAEAFRVLVLLRDRGQGGAADPPVVFFELRCERGGQRLGEAAGGGAGRRAGSDGGRDLRAKDEDALTVPDTGDETDPVPFLHGAALICLAIGPVDGKSASTALSANYHRCCALTNRPVELPRRAELWPSNDPANALVGRHPEQAKQARAAGVPSAT